MFCVLWMLGKPGCLVSIECVGIGGVGGTGSDSAESSAG